MSTSLDPVTDRPLFLLLFILIILVLVLEDLEWHIEVKRIIREGAHEHSIDLRIFVRYYWHGYCVLIINFNHLIVTEEVQHQVVALVKLVQHDGRDQKLRRADLLIHVDELRRLLSIPTIKVPT